jgi:hypothetical protein
MGGLTYPNRLKQLNIPSLVERRIRADLILTYRIIKGQIESLPLDDFFVKATTCTRGNSEKLYIQRYNVDPVKYSFANRVPPIWNSLADDVVTAPSLAVFKSRLSNVDLSDSKCELVRHYMNYALDLA